MFWTRVVAAAVAFTTTSMAFAWGNQGHQTVGAIADQLIAGTNAEAQVKGLLKPGESLESVSIWADCAKGYCGPLTPEMKAFVARNPKHHDYHFTDLPFQASAYVPGAVGTSDHDVVQILQECIGVLQGQSSAGTHGFTSREALLLIAHFVGDIHQPLHVGTAYVDLNDSFVVPADEAAIDDANVFATHGDNYLMLGSRALHAYWDSQAVTYAMKSAQAQSPSDFAAYLRAHPSHVNPSTGSPGTWPKKWATESVLASQKAHAGMALGERSEAQDRNGNPHQSWSIEVPQGYARTAASMARSELWAAGSRLAALLQAIWP